MRWILLIASVFGFCGLVAISYWRQTSADVSPALLILVLIGLPILIIASVYGVCRLQKWFKARSNVVLEQPPERHDEISTDDSKMPWLSVYAVTVQTQLGDHADQIIEGLRQFQTAVCDEELWNANGAKLLSRRIDLAMNSSIVDSDDHTNFANGYVSSVRARRIEALTQNIYDQLDSVLTTIAEGMAETFLSQEPHYTQQAILHPAWQGKEATESVQNSITEQLYVWPKQLKILHLLPHHLSVQDQQYLQQAAVEQMLNYGFQVDQLQWTHRITKDADETLQYLEQTITAQSRTSESSVLLVMGVDSHLDQDLIDQLLPKSPNLIPTESSFSFLITNDLTPIPTLPILSRITMPILKGRQKPMRVGELLEATALNHCFDEFRHFYPSDIVNLVSDQRILITDINSSKNMNLRELALVLQPFDLQTENLIYSGSLLESTSALAPGLSLAIAMQHAESTEQHVPMISSSGDLLRGLWLATSYSPIATDAVTQEEVIKEIPKNA
ncbi:MAG: hypothetical protein KGO49_02290 [Gammaproteobacteria bacterium]|nr:hypothetical protein [Gammaproteobacteria bacterium]